MTRYKPHHEKHLASGDQLVTSDVHVEGMDCPDEIAELKKALSSLEGVVNLSFNLLRGRMTVQYDASSISIDQIVSLVAETGMSATLLGIGEAGDASQKAPSCGPLWMTILSATGTVLGLALSAVPTFEIYHTTWLSAVAYVLAICAAWRYVAPKAWSALRRFRLDMNVLMTIAVVGAVALGEWFEASTVAFLFMVSHLLENWSVSRARRAIQSLMELSPLKARLLSPDGSERELDTEEVEVGSRIIVKPGEKFPLDGQIIEGTTSANQAPITGESASVYKELGDDVFAGSINQDGAVIVKTTKVADDTVLASIIRLVEDAQARRSPSERFVDRFAHYYTPVVVIGAVLLCVIPPLVLDAAWGTWLYRALVLLVIACPCALVISTPVTIVSGLAAAARNGVLIKGGEYLEAVGRASTAAFDKTGTLTVGQPVVQEVIPLNDTSHDILLELAAAIEQRSEHPIAQAIFDYAKSRGIDPPSCDQYWAIRGKGAQAIVSGEDYLIGNHRLLEEHGLCTEDIHQLMIEHEDCAHSVVALASRSKPLGIILLADGLRKEAPHALAEMRQAGIQSVVMLTGDNAGTAKSIAEQCGLIDYRAELLPVDKVAAINDLKADERSVIMVGDGINDAPALAAASVGIAMGAGGTDAALETADIALMTNDLAKLPWLLRHSRRTKRIIIQNITVSLGIKAMFMLLAVPGIATLWMAIAADMGASLLVTFNGLRLLRTNPSEGLSAQKV